MHIIAEMFADIADEISTRGLDLVWDLDIDPGERSIDVWLYVRDSQDREVRYTGTFVDTETAVETLVSEYRSGVDALVACRCTDIYGEITDDPNHVIDVSDHPEGTAWDEIVANEVIDNMEIADYWDVFHNARDYGHWVVAATLDTMLQRMGV